MKKTKSFINILYGVSAFLFPVLCLIAVYILSDIYPFGNVSNYSADLQVQYHDFFCYFKDVLTGEADIGYTFSKSLGGSPVAIIGYYLLSPFNLLVLFFEKSQMQLFVFVLTCIKHGLCSLCCYIFVKYRFKISNVFCLILSLAYAFTQYGMGQSSNLMWLDGMYLLPIIMLGIYLYVKDGKPLLFYIATACSVVFCWYTGYMNCIFAMIYFICEMLLHQEKFGFVSSVKKILKFAVLEIISVLLSCFVFFPVVMSQLSGRVSDGGFFKGTTNGKLLDVFRGFLFGADFPSAQITLFCTVIVLLFFFSYWFSKRSPRKEKIILGSMLGIMVASMFFKPIENIWCGFKFETSYVYRFAYIAVIVMIYIAAMQIKNVYIDGSFVLSDKSFIRGAAAFVTILLVSDWIAAFDPKKLWLEIFLIVFYTFAVYLLANRDKLKSLRISGFVKSAVSVMLFFVFLAEVILNANLVAKGKYTHSAAFNSQYTHEQQQLIDRIQALDKGMYRIEQIQNRSGAPVNKFYANEALAYGYNGLQVYTSCYDSAASEIMASSGYCTSYFPSFYNNPILPMDSFFGVKYLLSDKSFLGYEKAETEGSTQKDVYYNPYAQEIGFGVHSDALSEIKYSNSFEYANGLYSAALGEKTLVFEKISPDSQTQNEAGEVKYTFTNKTDAESMILYVSFENQDIVCDDLCINGEKYSRYDKVSWGTWDNVSYLGKLSEINEVSLRNCNLSQQELLPQFYCVDIGRFSNISEKLRKNSVRVNEVRGGYIDAAYTSNENGQVLFTLPFEENWSATVNGKKVECLEGAGAFLTVPVEAGENQINIKYNTPGKYMGMVLTAFSVIMFLMLFVFRKKKY